MRDLLQVQGWQGWQLGMGLPMPGSICLYLVSITSSRLGASTWPRTRFGEELVLLAVCGDMASHSCWAAAGQGLVQGSKAKSPWAASGQSSKGGVQGGVLKT